MSLVLVAALVFSGAALGQTEVPHEFTAGQPARAAEVNANFDTLEQAIQQLAQSANVMWMGDWQNGVSYAIGDIVQFQGSAYIAEQATSGTENPTNATYWSLVVSAGAEGPQGPPGATGAVGPQGPQGPIGLTGDTGPQGPQGPMGLPGAEGPQGVQGDTGPQGPIGLTGDTGPQGPQGVQGPFGPEGPQGPEGPEGPAGGPVEAGSIGLTEINLAEVQVRVGGSCDYGNFIAAISEDGSVTCMNGTGANGNTRYGSYALRFNTGNSNTASGERALYSNTTGELNTAIGYDALYSNTAGRLNTAIGYNALNNASADGNTAVGAIALQSVTYGGANTALGYYSAYYISSGNFNTAVGVSSLNVRTGNNNIALGHQAGYEFTEGDNNILIGNRGVNIESNTTRIGEVQTRAFIAGVRGAATEVQNAVTVVIDSNGQLGTISSSRRYKKDIADMAATSDRLLQLRPVTFRYKETFEDGEQPLQYGLIAEEVADVFPELVVFNEQSQPETVKYRLLSSLLLNELQKQQSEINDLSGQVAELSDLVNQMAGAENRPRQ
jgi:hypothetical protein